MRITRLFALFLTAAFSLSYLSVSRAADHQVSMYFYNFATSQAYYYNPATVTVPKGDTVTWVNADTVPYGGHTATSGSGGVADGLWDSGLVANENDTYTLSTTNLAAGSYPYFCSVDEIYNMAGTLVVTAPAGSPPSVSITNLVSGARVRAGGNVTLMASASDSDGTVTNVQFFSGITSLGNVASAPFNFTVNALAAGNYSFTAQASDNSGLTTTSAAIAVFVQTNATISSSAVMSDGGFQLTLNGIAGQTYAIETSSNLFNWTPLVTNLAPTDVFSITDSTSGLSLQRFYRVRQDF